VLLNDLSVGQVVMSKSGRDKGRLFFVLKIVNDEYVLISDGDTRKLDKPKLKKVKHLIKYKLISKDVKNKILSSEDFNDAFLRCELKRLRPML
jgi:ribosomal protein L14E/L6E/L27E